MKSINIFFCLIYITITGCATHARHLATNETNLDLRHAQLLARISNISTSETETIRIIPSRALPITSPINSTPTTQASHQDTLTIIRHAVNSSILTDTVGDTIVEKVTTNESSSTQKDARVQPQLSTGSVHIPLWLEISFLIGVIIFIWWPVRHRSLT